MDLSTAIREGATKRPQVTDGFMLLASGSCALGAAYEALTGRASLGTDQNPYGTMAQSFPVLMQEVHGCPADGECTWKPATVMDRVIHLNDDHHWTRERIADWVETL